MLVEFGRAGLIAKARKQPDKVRAAIDKIRTDGLMPTIEAIRNRLDQPLPMGYCNVGTVVDVGEGVAGFSIGDRVASNGRHAEVVCVPKNLCAKVPPSVSDDAAAFTVVGAIALEGIRLAQPALGESVAVLGLGLIGLLAVQLLRANGCRVLGVDLDPRRIALARAAGAETVDLSRGEDPVAAAAVFSKGRGVDAVLVAASTKSSDPVHQAAAMCRKRGRIVLVGVVGLELSRADFYEKELSFQVSCSYGPGRYDAQYEERGHDYPVGFVRWTAQRNFEAVLDMLADGRLAVEPLVSHRFPIDDVDDAYRLVAQGSNSLGILLRYPADEDASAPARAVVRLAAAARTPRKAGDVRIGVIGAGNHATQVLIPCFRDAGAMLASVASQSGVGALHAAKKYGFEQATTDAEALLDDAGIDAVVIATRHDSHARYVCRALRAHKDVFVEKPLAIRRDELAEVESAVAQVRSGDDAPRLMVGFNRRFAPHVQTIKALLAVLPEPKSFVVTVNAGALPAEHWTQDRDVGGGRIVGEACHFVDLLRFLAGAPIASVCAAGLGNAARAAAPPDAATITVAFADGSVGAVHYFPNGHKSYPKERLEVFCASRVLQLDNFRTLKGFGWPGFGRTRLWRQDKGNRACVTAFVEAIRDAKPSPIPAAELLEVARATLDVAESIER